MSMSFMQRLLLAWRLFQLGHASVVSLLLGHHAEVNMKNENGATCLYIAAQHGHTEIIEMLLDRYVRRRMERFGHVEHTRICFTVALIRRLLIRVV